jgi:hypothetical protein
VERKGQQGFPVGADGVRLAAGGFKGIGDLDRHNGFS